MFSFDLDYFGYEDQFHLLSIAGLHKFDTVDEIVECVNRYKVGGFDDWVVPPNAVLLAVASMIGSEPVYAWSSSPFMDNPKYAWYVGFKDGGLYYGRGDECGAVRLVRASQLREIGIAGLEMSIAQAGIEV